MLTHPYTAAPAGFFADEVSSGSVNSYLREIFKTLPRASVVEQLIEQLVQTEDTELRDRVIYPLSQLGGALAHAAVRQLAADDPNEGVRERAASALKHWKTDKD